MLPGCRRCGGAIEDITHCFWSCSFSIQTWKTFAKLFNVDVLGETARSSFVHLMTLRILGKDIFGAYGRCRDLGRTNSPTSARRGDGLGFIRIWATPSNRLVFWDGAPSPSLVTMNNVL